MERIRTRGEDGRIVVVVKQAAGDSSSRRYSPSWAEDAPRHFLGDGSVVNAVRDFFEVIATGERLRRI